MAEDLWEPTPNTSSDATATRVNSRRRRRRRIALLAGTLGGLAALLVVLAFLHPHTVSRYVWRLYLMLNPEEANDAGKPSPTSQEDSDETLANLYLPALIQIDRPLGFTADRNGLYLQVVSGDFAAEIEGAPRRSLWRIDLTSGEYRPLTKGNLEAASTWGAGVAFLVQPRAVRQRQGVWGWFSPFYRLWALSPSGDPQFVDEGSIDLRWFGFAPDGRTLLYQVHDDAGLRTFLYDLETRQKREWVEPESRGDTKGEDLAVAWIDGGSALLRMTRVPVQLRGGRMGSAATRFQVTSVENPEILEETPGLPTQVLLDGPIYNGAHHFFLHTRPCNARNDPREEQIDIFGLSPLRRVVSEPGMAIYWTLDARYALIEKCGPTDKDVASVVGLFQAETGDITAVDFQRLDPPFQRLAPFVHHLLSSGPHLLSPDSTSVVVVSYGEQRLGILNLDTLTVTRTVEGVSGTSFLWSPDSRRIAFLGRRRSDLALAPFLLQTETGEITPVQLLSMRPICWLDSRTVLWANRWPGALERAGPLTLALVNADTGVIRLLPVE